MLEHHSFHWVVLSWYNIILVYCWAARSSFLFCSDGRLFSILVSLDSSVCEPPVVERIFF